MPEASCPGWSQKIVYVPAARVDTVNTKLSPAETSSLAASRLPVLSRITMSCDVVPELTRKKTTFPAGALTAEGSNLNSVIVTLRDPAGWEGPPPPPPQPASRATDARAAASALIGTASHLHKG